MMFSEDDLLPISALEHLAFCERQWGLIHLEGMWSENRLTAEGRRLHERTHAGGTETRVGVRITRGLRLRSLRLGLTGQADVVEFYPASDVEAGSESAGVRFGDAEGVWRPFPIEYKRGRPKAGRCDEAQICAQALCLEEMLQVVVTSGALFYGQPRRRLDVSFDESLRQETEELAARLHELTRLGRTPEARHEKKCESCSLLSCCMPQATDGKRSADRYLSRAMTEIVRAGAEEVT